MKTSLQVVARALRQNGYKQGFGAFVNKNSKGKVVSACAIAQAALNLKCDPANLHAALTKITNAQGVALAHEITDWNDQNKWTLDQIADRIERDWTDYLNQDVSAR